MNDTKNKFIGIMQLLYENTDADHSMDTYQIMNSLAAMHYAKPDRKTIDANIKYLIEEVGFGIEKEKGKPNRYKWSRRSLNLDELKMIADALRSSAFVPNKQRRKIITKLKDFTSIHLAGSLDREIVTCDYYEFNHHEVQPFMDTIFEAIRENKKIKFSTFKYDIYCNEVPCNDYNIVSPHLIIWNMGNFYMVGTPIDENRVQHYRINSFSECEITSSKADAPPEGFSAANYSRHSFDMLSGEYCEVVLDCENETLPYIIDRFGQDLNISVIDDEHFNVKISTDVNIPFYSWIFAFAGKVKIAGPERVCAGFRNMVNAQSSVSDML